MITCIRNHPEPGAHRVTCPDHDGWSVNPGECRGCLPRAAERGFLCTPCYDRTVNAVAAWHDFRAAVQAAEGRLVSPDTGGTKSAAPSGYANLSLVFLALDECERHLASRDGRTVDLWIHDEDGARDAIRFAIAAEQAYGSLEVAERERQLVRERCPECGRLTTYGHVAREERGVMVVTCDFCQHELARVRPDITRWRGSATCEHTLHAECDALDCRCDCHLLGAQSRPGGVQALWDADQHAVTSRRRAGRATHTWREPRAGDWITHRIRGTLRERRDQYRADWIVQDALTITAERTAA